MLREVLFLVKKAFLFVGEFVHASHLMCRGKSSSQALALLPLTVRNPLQSCSTGLFNPSEGSMCELCPIGKHSLNFQKSTGKP